MTELLDFIFEHPRSVVVCGDINVDFLVETAQMLTVRQFFLSYGLDSRVTEITRPNPRGGSLLDNIFTNISEDISQATNIQCLKNKLTECGIYLKTSNELPKVVISIAGMKLKLCNLRNTCIFVNQKMHFTEIEDIKQLSVEEHIEVSAVVRTVMSKQKKINLENESDIAEIHKILFDEESVEEIEQFDELEEETRGKSSDIEQSNYESSVTNKGPH
ncbi:hypothetical protein JTB14_033447 [Gonioctena quinquepunctata]|nr:hypothetical protein JTB14_033447 [Gonioctena quinquepunctata]